jgi:hypothetical protein
VIFRAVALAVVLCCAATACDSGAAPGPPPTAAPSHTVTGGAPADMAYTLNLLDGAKVVQVHAAPLHGHLFQITTPTGSEVVPAAHQDGSAVEVNLAGGGNGDLSITLDEIVPWNLKFSSGVSTLSVDMRSGTLRGLTALQGISTVDLTAGAPHGRVVLRELGGMSVLALHVPRITPVSVKAYAGAGTVSVFGQSESGVSAGTTLSSPYLGPSLYRVDAVGGVGTLTVYTAG